LSFVSVCFFSSYVDPPDLHSFPTRRSSDLQCDAAYTLLGWRARSGVFVRAVVVDLRAARRKRDLGHRWRYPAGFAVGSAGGVIRSEEHTSELQSRENLVCRLLLEKKNKRKL